MARLLPTAAVILGVLAINAGVGEPSLTGVSYEPPGGQVLWVDPSSLAWAAGIRAGDLVLAVPDSAESEDWSLATTSDGSERALTRRAQLATLRLGLVPAVLGTLLGMAGAIAPSRHRRRPETLGVIALFLAWVPLAASHDPTIGPVAGSVVGIAAAVWLYRWADARRVALAIGIAAFALDIASGTARLMGLPSVVELEAIRFQWTAVAVILVVAVGVNVTPRALAHRTSALRYVDVAAVGAITLLIVGAEIVSDPPIWTPLVIAIIGAIVYRPVRGTVRTWIDRQVYAEERERTAIKSAESERARLSRELHDDPLQTLVGVILRLEDKKEAPEERETLRVVAAQLRKIATTLHPPVLDDLGLVPAVESLFADSGPIPVELDIESTSGYRRDDRPPFEVELASYRIIQEAATNAIRHSGCQHVIVRGHVSRTAVAIDVVDDGRGINERELEAALRGGRLGVASMRRRAEAIDAVLVHDRAPGAGTVVRLRWPS